MFQDRKPLTPTQVRCAGAEKALSEAVQKYCLAVQEDRLAAGTSNELADAALFSFRDTLNLCAHNVLTLILSWAKLQSPEQPLPAHVVEEIFRDMMCQVTEHQVEELPEHIETIEDVAAAAERS